MEIKNSLKNSGVGVFRNGCGYSGLRTRKLAVSQGGIHGLKYFCGVDKNLGKPEVSL